jgi:hypothetical protein
VDLVDELSLTVPLFELLLSIFSVKMYQFVKFPKVGCGEIPHFPADLNFFEMAGYCVELQFGPQWKHHLPQQRRKSRINFIHCLLFLG